MSHPFFFSNGVRQGSVLSPVLFTVYLDGLLQKLSKTGVGGVVLDFTDTVSHLGHLLSYNLDNMPDIIRATKNLLSGAISSPSSLIRCVFSDSSQCGYSCVGYKFQYGYRHLKMYFSHDMLCAEVIRHYRTAYGRVTPFENIIRTISCD